MYDIMQPLESHRGSTQWRTIERAGECTGGLSPNRHPRRWNHPCRRARILRVHLAQHVSAHDDHHSDPSPFYNPSLTPFPIWYSAALIYSAEFLFICDFEIAKQIYQQSAAMVLIYDIRFRVTFEMTDRWWHQNSPSSITLLLLTQIYSLSPFNKNVILINILFIVTAIIWQNIPADACTMSKDKYTYFCWQKSKSLFFRRRSCFFR